MEQGIKKKKQRASECPIWSNCRGATDEAAIPRMGAPLGAHWTPSPVTAGAQGSVPEPETRLQGPAGGEGWKEAGLGLSGKTHRAACSCVFLP